MSKSSTAKYYQDKKEKKTKIKFLSYIKVFLQKKKKKSSNMVMKDIKV